MPNQTVEDRIIGIESKIARMKNYQSYELGSLWDSYVHLSACLLLMLASYVTGGSFRSSFIAPIFFRDDAKQLRSDSELVTSIFIIAVFFAMLSSCAAFMGISTSLDRFEKKLARYRETKDVNGIVRLSNRIAKAEDFHKGLTAALNDVEYLRLLSYPKTMLLSWKTMGSVGLGVTCGMIVTSEVCETIRRANQPKL